MNATTAKPNFFIIDVETAGAVEIIHALRKLESTVSCFEGGVYSQDADYCQLKLVSTLEEAQVEEFLYAGNFDYVGVVQFHCSICGEQIVPWEAQWNSGTSDYPDSGWVGADCDALCWRKVRK